MNNNCYGPKNKRFLLLLKNVYFSAVLWGFVLGAFLNFGPAVAETNGYSRPVYLEELEYYRISVEQHKILQERQKREETLKDALIQHQIKKGETLSGIAALYGTNVQALAYWNNISNPHFIRAGQVLDIVTIKGSLHHVAKKDTLERIARDYSVEPAVVAEFNLLDEKKLIEGQKLVIPGGISPAERVVVPVTILASRGERRLPESISCHPLFEWPLNGTITSYFGMRNGLFHFGLDIAAPHGEEIRAAADGVVEYSGVQRGYGRMLIIDHGSGWNTLYAHNSKNLVSKGDQVLSGQFIARVGATGNATGPHVHLEIIFGSLKLDPLLFLP